MQLSPTTWLLSITDSMLTVRFIFPVPQKDAQFSWLTKGLAGIAKGVLAGERISALSAAAVRCRAGALSLWLTAMSLGSQKVSKSKSFSSSLLK